ncbi:hypothetical protein SAMD00019534_039780, partial [Acytostelium subglobosum LB1]|uniref:hypothetical protein n=1 Tax=Acytostelium subglobosum LB1 TaxID=1410327 RepID=UPI0006451B34
MNGQLESIFQILRADPPKYLANIPKRETKDNNLLDVLCTVINRLITQGDQINTERREFYPPNRKPPTIGIDAYLARILKYSPCSKECFVLTMVYIDRFLSKCNLIINSMNIHRIVITSLLISTKYLDDIFYNNEFYSQVGGISLIEMNKLEVNFLSMMNYTVNCPLEEFERYNREVEKVKRKYELNELQYKLAHSGIMSTFNVVPLSSFPMDIPENHNKAAAYSNSKNSPVVPTIHKQAPATQSYSSSFQQVPQSSASATSTNNQTKIYINTIQQTIYQPLNNGASAASSSINTTRRGSCDHGVAIPNSEKAFTTTGWVA